MEFMEEGSLEKVIDAFPRIRMNEKQITYVCFEVQPLPSAIASFSQTAWLAAGLIRFTGIKGA